MITAESMLSKRTVLRIIVALFHWYRIYIDFANLEQFLFLADTIANVNFKALMFWCVCFGRSKTFYSFMQTSFCLFLPYF